MNQQHSQRYEVLDRLDAGGMAEVFRGKAISLGGLEKAVAIKRVLPSLAGNEKFVKMFIDEARLSLRLSHANIVSVFDIARSGSTYFIVMEFVDGTNLRRILERDSALPVDLAVLIAAEVCKGLAYAHERTDSEGRPLGVVHRDVSPPNILLSRKGEVKLTDFGLAKAKSQIETTDPGVVKGKFSYLSPEAARGEEVDPRADIFATGIVLWEMLAGRRLFLGETDQDTLRIVRRAEVPALAAINPAVPPALEDIVRKALARDAEQRYQSARDFAQALTRFAVASGTAASSFDLEPFVEAFLQQQKRPEPSNAVRDDLTRAVIQEEMNKLVRIGPVSQSMESVAPRPTTELVDPRTWQFGDEDEDDVHQEPGPPGANDPFSAQPTVEQAAVPRAAQPPGRGGTATPPAGVRPAPLPPHLRAQGRSGAPPPAPTTTVTAAAPPPPPASAPAVALQDNRSSYAARGEQPEFVEMAPTEIAVVRAAPRPTQTTAAVARPEAAPASDTPPARGDQRIFYALVVAIIVVAFYLLRVVIL